METQTESKERGGQPDNDNASIVKTENEANRLIDSFCRHLEQGLSKDCFEDCDYRTIESVIKRFDLQAGAKKIESAKRKGRRFWEAMGVNGSMGKREFKSSTGEKIKLGNFNALSWKFNMQNRFGWKERTDMTTDDTKINQPPTQVVFNNPNIKKDEPDGNELQSGA